MTDQWQAEWFLFLFVIVSLGFITLPSSLAAVESSDFVGLAAQELCTQVRSWISTIAAVCSFQRALRNWGSEMRVHFPSVSESFLPEPTQQQHWASQGSQGSCKSVQPVHSRTRECCSPHPRCCIQFLQASLCRKKIYIDETHWQQQNATEKYNCVLQVVPSHINEFYVEASVEFCQALEGKHAFISPKGKMHSSALLIIIL